MATHYSTAQRLCTIDPKAIPFGSLLPPATGDGPRRKPRFGNIDFLALTLAGLHTAGVQAVPRSLLSELWSRWRKTKLETMLIGTTASFVRTHVRETHARNRRVRMTLGPLLTDSLSWGRSSRFFTAGPTHGTWRLTIDGWRRVAQLVDAYAPEHPRPWTPIEMQVVTHPSEPQCFISVGATSSACELFTVSEGVFYRSGSIEELCRAGWYPAPGVPQFVKLCPASRDCTIKRVFAASLAKSDWVVNGLLVQHPNHGRDCYVKRDMRSGGWCVYTSSGALLREYATANALVAARWRPHRGPRRYFSESAQRVVRQPIDA